MKEITYVCDVCGKRSDDATKVRSYRVSVLKVYVDERGECSGREDEVRYLDLCDDCFDRSMALEMKVGPDGTVLGEHKVRFRQRGEE
jgi:hypothetical protein